MHELSLDAVWSRYQQARKRRRCWEGLWRDCYTYALPQRGAGFGQEFAPGRNPAERLFDSTAMDAVRAARRQSAGRAHAALVAVVRAGPSYGFFAEMLDGLSQSIQAHFDRSNFALEMHQAFLDLVTVGDATLLCEEAPVGSPSALRFTAVPMAEMVFDAGPEGQIQDHFRQSTLSPAALRARYPRAILPPMRAACESEDERPMRIVEAVLLTGGRFAYLSLLDQDGGRPLLLDSGTFETSPFISFRWMKGAAEVYGPSPMMSALPDIKTVNKVVELILKNASIAVTGIWQADDDGVLNPANIRLVPGSIIPKAVGSAGLTPLQAPGRFDISSLMLDDLRSRIRRTLLADRLGPLSGPRMTATEVLERSNETARLLGATFGRLQTELLTPLLTRAFAILRRRGEVADLALDGRMVDLKYKSPLARVQARQDVENTLLWLEAAGKLGPEAMRAIDLTATAKWLGHSLGVPAQLVRDHEPAATLLSELIDGAAEMAAAEPDDGA